MMKKHGSCYFFAVTMTVTYTYWWNYRSLVHSLVGAKVPRSESPRVRKFQGAKVPHLELSLPRANGLASEKSIIHKQVGLQLKQ